MLEDKDIKNFMELYQTRFGKDITKEEAAEKEAKLVRLVELIYKPMTKSEFKILQKRRKETNTFRKQRKDRGI